MCQPNTVAYMTEVRYLTSEDVVDLADINDYVEAAHDGFRQRGEGADADNPDKSANKDSNVAVISYAASLPDDGVLGGYIFSTGDSVDGWYVTTLFDSTDGTPLAIIDGGSWNPYKTGSAGGVGVDVLSRPDVDSIGVIGSGSQARAQLEAINCVREFETVEVFSPTKAHREEFASDMNSSLDARVMAVDSTEEAIADSDILVVATKASGPVFDGDLLEPGMHVNAVGQEKVDVTTIQRGKYIPDHRGRGLSGHSSLAEYIEEGTLSASDLHAELGDVVVGNTPGRESDDDITVFDSSGTGIETIAAGNMLYERALEHDRGSTVTVTPASEGFVMSDFVKAYQLD